MIFLQEDRLKRISTVNSGKFFLHRIKINPQDSTCDLTKELSCNRSTSNGLDYHTILGQKISHFLTNSNRQCYLTEQVARSFLQEGVFGGYREWISYCLSLIILRSSWLTLFNSTGNSHFSITMLYCRAGET